MNKFERCVLKVKGKQPKSCEKNKWKGKKCYNPWAICNKSVGKPRRVGRPKKSCKSGFVRDKITKRCRKSKTSRKTTKKSRKKSRKTTKKSRKKSRKTTKKSRKKSRKTLRK